MKAKSLFWGLNLNKDGDLVFLMVWFMEEIMLFAKELNKKEFFFGIIKGVFFVDVFVGFKECGGFNGFLIKVLK